MTARRAWLPRAGAALAIGLAVTAVAAPWLTPYDPMASVGPPSAPPDARHWLGTNDIGQDIFSELIFGARTSLFVGLMAGVIATGIGTIVGLVAGVGRRTVATLLMRLADLVLVLPFLPLVVVLAAYLGTSRWQVAGLLGLVMWARTARVVRAVVRGEAARDYVLAARAIGAGPWRILAAHLLPAVAPQCAVQFTQVAGAAIALEASLAFLGLGDPTAKSWGTMLYYAQARNAFLTGQWPWWVVPPGLMITGSVLAFALLGLGTEPRRSSPR